jgi:hypothetical protein
MTANIRINSEGDLEIIILYENQEAFTDILNPNLYAVLGEVPEQNIVFHNDSCFDLFVVHTSELFAEGSNNVRLNGKTQNFSLFGGALWLCERYEDEARRAGLTSACDALNSWLEKRVPFAFWCSNLHTQFELEMSRKELLSFAGNLSKHNILRLNILLSRLQRLFERNGSLVEEQDLIGVLEPFVAELKSRLLYHSSFLVEMLYDYFAAINRFIINRFDIMKTNDVRKMKLPDTVSSDSYRNLYGDTLVFRRYDEARFSKFKPTTTEYLKMRY